MKRLLKLALALILLYPAEKSFSEETLSSELFNKLESENKSIQISSENLAQYESLLMPYMADIILAFNLQLKVSSLEEPKNTEIPDQEELIREFNSYPLPLLTEVDLDLLAGSNSIQASAKRLTGTEDSKSLAFKEKLEVSSPSKLSKLKFLTIRQKGPADDLLWYFSPTINKSVELTSSNRADLLFNSLFSLEDIFSFGAKPEAFTVSDIKSADLLAPASIQTAWTYQKAIDGKCDSFSSSIKDSTAYSSKATLTRQKLLAINLKNSDPFSETGRIRIYLSADTLIPILKEEYSHQGLLKKVVLTGMIRTSDNYLLPAVSMLISGSIDSNKSRKTAFISYSNGRVCSELPADFKTSDLDPSTYWKET